MIIADDTSVIHMMVRQLTNMTMHQMMGDHMSLTCVYA